MASNRVHSAVNLTLLPAFILLGDWALWRRLPLHWGWRALTMALATPCLLFAGHHLVPRLTGPVLNALVRGKSHGRAA